MSGGSPDPASIGQDDRPEPLHIEPPEFDYQERGGRPSWVHSQEERAQGPGWWRRLFGRRQPPQDERLDRHVALAYVDMVIRNGGLAYVDAQGAVVIDDLGRLTTQVFDGPLRLVEWGDEELLLEAIRKADEECDPEPEDLLQRNLKALARITAGKQERRVYGIDEDHGASERSEDPQEPVGPPPEGVESDTRPKGNYAYTHWMQDGLVGCRITGAWYATVDITRVDCPDCLAIRPDPDARPNTPLRSERTGVETWAWCAMKQVRGYCDLHEEHVLDERGAWRADESHRPDRAEGDSATEALAGLAGLVGGERAEAHVRSFADIVHHLPDDPGDTQGRAVRPTCGVGVLDWFRGTADWEKVTCERCLAAVSDARSEVHYGPEGGGWLHELPPGTHEVTRVARDVTCDRCLAELGLQIMSGDFGVIDEQAKRDAEAAPEQWWLLDGGWHLISDGRSECGLKPTRFRAEILGQRPKSRTPTCSVCEKIADRETPTHEDWSKRRHLLDQPTTHGHGWKDPAALLTLCGKTVSAMLYASMAPWADMTCPDCLATPEYQASAARAARGPMGDDKVTGGIDVPWSAASAGQRFSTVRVEAPEAPEIVDVAIKPVTHYISGPLLDGSTYWGSRCGIPLRDDMRLSRDLIGVDCTDCLAAARVPRAGDRATCHGNRLYWCPEARQIECADHGGFLVCCGHPERHWSMDEIEQFLALKQNQDLPARKLEDGEFHCSRGCDPLGHRTGYASQDEYLANHRCWVSS